MPSPLTDTFSGRNELRHLLATMVYRATRATERASAKFGTFHVHTDSRTPVEILAHIGDLCEWALSMARGEGRWREAVPLEWNAELNRFYASVKTLDDYLAGAPSVSCPIARLAQGPIADAVSHVGQLAMLRRIAGEPMRGENFFLADIKAGQVGPDQPPPRKTFA